MIMLHLILIKKLYQGVSQERKKFCVLHELGNKTLLGVWGHYEPLSGLSGGPGGQSLWKTNYI